VTEPSWLGVDFAIKANKRAVGQTGEPHSLLYPNLLESGLARPQHRFAYGEEDPVVLAVALLFGIARNHPFEQGNKRTALACALRFLENNGYVLVLPNTDFLGAQLVAVLTGDLSEDAFGAMFASYVREIEDT
jgi:death on curing protein